VLKYNNKIILNNFISFHDGTTPEMKNRTVDRWRRLGSEILCNNFILTWNHGLRGSNVEKTQARA